MTPLLVPKRDALELTANPTRDDYTSSPPQLMAIVMLTAKPKRDDYKSSPLPLMASVPWTFSVGAIPHHPQ